ncbi:MAG: Ser/Thr protein kinase RdoA (MazF antagonist) [Granulosicoccus sp.]|jgi:Ser/Thr protein kinase RdoA (MazF antagonist)
MVTINLTHALSLWSLSTSAKATLINVSENRTYLVTDARNVRMILREHRLDYHSEQEIRSELMWIEALRHESDVSVSTVIPGLNGKAIQTVHCNGDASERHLVMFEFLEGNEPNDDKALYGHFNTLGHATAQLHTHSMQWRKPNNFVRREWNIDTVLSPHAAWGHWSKGPNVDNVNRPVLSALESMLIQRLSHIGMGDDVYGLIHADLRTANLLLDHEAIHVIDFDDCGFSWYLYDFATAVSFMEDHPRIEDLKAHWLEGYRRHRHLSCVHEAELDTLILFRRLALLGWMGTHANVDIVKDLSATFAEGTAMLAECYLGMSGQTSV